MDESKISLVLGIGVVVVCGILVTNYFEDNPDSISNFVDEITEQRTEYSQDQKENHGCLDGVKEIEYQINGSVKKVICID